jgi:hypothetical protein
MSLPQLLLPPPTDHGLDEWSFSHWQHHVSIAWAVQQKHNVNLDVTGIWPVFVPNIDIWLRYHQQLHNEMNAVLNVQGNDLSTFDWEDPKQREGFFFLNWQEHRSCAINTQLPI